MSQRRWRLPGNDGTAGSMLLPRDTRMHVGADELRHGGDVRLPSALPASVRLLLPTVAGVLVRLHRDVVRHDDDAVLALDALGSSPSSGRHGPS